MDVRAAVLVPPPLHSHFDSSAVTAQNDGCKETNVFDKPNDQSQACMSFGVARKRGSEETNVFDKSNADKLACMLKRENDGCKETNVFDKPNDQSQACMSFGVARKRGIEDTNDFRKPLK